MVTATNGERRPSMRYYNCRGFLRTGRTRCEGNRVAVDVLDRAVLSHAAERLFTVERCKEILRDFVEAQGLLRQKTADKRRVLERERDEIPRRLSRWYELLEPGRAEESDALDRTKELRTKFVEVKAVLDEVHALHS